MPSLEEVVDKLRKNSKESFKELQRLIVKIGENILKDPDNRKIRTLKKSNAMVSQKILRCPGGAECLKLMGFEESETDFTLPHKAPLQKVKFVIDNVNVDRVFNVPEEKIVRKIELPPFSPRYENQFLKSIEYRFHFARMHDDVTLYEQAKEIIAEADIEELAVRKLRNLQKGVKCGELPDPNFSIQEILLLQLLGWFKNDFFTWVDNPKCDNCGGTTNLSHMSTDSELLKFTDRVEMHRCEACEALTPFGRFNDPNVLMATRRGRCGEWSNVFTLFCRAIGWDARQVFDETDHVWTEVYSIAQKRWLHCDPCETALDTPLMYEHGWKKNLTYIIAYSGEDLQDVTWRYSSDHKQILQRRNRCTEKELIETIITLRTERWNDMKLSESRKAYLTRRNLEELIELMVEKKPSEGDSKGRNSGSMSWRLARGEISELVENNEGFIWKIGNKGENLVSIGYCTGSDKYGLKSNTRDESFEGFQKGISRMNGIFRKEEKDWKTVYLCRTETADIGSITWEFEVEPEDRSIDQIKVNCDYTTFESGNIKISLSNTSKTIIFNKDQKDLTVTEFSGERRFEITAELTGGTGNVFWQHAQLFRQPSDSKEFPFSIEIKLK